MDDVVSTVVRVFKSYMKLGEDPSSSSFKISVSLNLLKSARDDDVISKEEYAEVCKIIRNSNNKG